MRKSTVALITSVLISAPAIARAQFVIEGVVHESTSLAPISDVAVLLIDETTGTALSPGGLDDPTQQGQVTGPDGRYRFEVRTPTNVRIDIERPDARFIFPSGERPPQGIGPFGGLACGAVPCPNGQIDDSTEPRENGPYALRFTVVPIGASGRNNHIPIDQLDELVTAELGSDRLRLNRGAHVVITATFESRAVDPIDDAEVVLAIPPELRVVPSSISLVRRGATNTAVDITPRQSDLLLRLGPAMLAPGERLELRLAARAVRVPERAAVSVRTWLERPGGIIVSNEPTLSLKVQGDPTLDQSTIYGRVFCDNPDTGRAAWQDDGERGVFGARVYLDTGFYAETDQNGLFHFSGVPAGTHLVKLDRETLSEDSKLISPELLQLYLSPGTPAKIRYAVHCVYDEWTKPTKVDIKTTTVTAPLSGTRTVDVSLGVADRSLNIADTRYVFPSGAVTSVPIDGGARLRFTSVAPYTPTRWRVRVSEISPAGEVTRGIEEHAFTGRGVPPLFIDWRWDRPPSGTYRATVEFESEDVDRFVSAPHDFGPVAPPPPLPSDDPNDLELLMTLPAPAEGASFAVDELVRLLETRRAAGSIRVVLFGHWDAGEGDDVAKDSGLALAERLAKQLAERGAASEPAVRSLGATAPLVPNISARLRQRNRRVDVRIGTPLPPPPPPPPRAPPAVRDPPRLVIEIDNKAGAIPLDPWADATVTVDLDAPATLRVTLFDPDGGTATLSRVITTNWVTRVGAREPQAIVVTDDGSALTVGTERTIDLSAYQLAFGGTSAALVVSSATPPVQWSVEVRGGASADILLEASGFGAIPAPLVLTETSSSSAGPKIIVAQAQFGEGIGSRRTIPFDALASNVAVESRVMPLGDWAEPDEPLDVSGRTLHVVGTTDVFVPMPLQDERPRARPPGVEDEVTDLDRRVAAADVRMSVTQNKSKRTRLRYPIQGTTRPTNAVRVNGSRVPVDADGQFAINVDLEPGANTVRVETEDELGNRATFERSVETSSSSWFLMALGEGEVGLGFGRLAGSNRHTHVNAGSVSLDGRAVAYGRARIALDGPFKRIDVVGRIDTGQLPDATVTRLEDDPLRLLPAFGDASVEVQDTASRHKIDLTVSADDSTLAVGNRNTTLDGFADDGYFDFRGSGFGVHGRIEKRFGEHDETRVTGMVGLENDGVRRGHDELLGSGGTMYWLSNRDVVEGSERVRLVVRDRDTGHALETVVKERGVDYEIRPHEGRLVFREPVSHVVGAAQTGINRSIGLTGHPIYIVVDYGHLANDADDTTFGIEARETIYDRFEIYGAAAGESGIDGRHRLYGVGLAYRPTSESFLEFEYAHSSGTTSAGRLSNDGGLTFGDLDLSARAPTLGDVTESSGPFFGALDGNALSLVGQLSIGDLFTARAVEDRPRGYVRAYGKKAGLLFSSLGSARQSGRMEGGFATSYDLTPTITARASFDAAVFVRPEAIGSMPTADVSGTFRGLLDLGVTYRTEEHGLGVQFLHLHTDPLPLAGSASSTGLSARYERSLTPDLTLILAQDAIVAPDAITNDSRAILGTTVGATYRLTERLDLSVFETLRWNGDNATQLGVRFRGDDGFSTYVAERFAHAGGEPMLATIIGAEDIVAEGSRTYGELHLGGAAHPTTTRAVIGMDNRWNVAPGVDALLAYERTHLLVETVLPNADGRSPFTAPFGGLASTLGGFGAVAQILPGAVSRDALAVGLAYTGLERLKLSSRIELRIDNGDEATGGRDFRVIGTHLGAALVITRDLSMLGRLTAQHVTDTLADVTYAKAIEGSLAAAFRPRAEDWFTLIVRYTRLDQQRPRSLTDDRRVAETRDALSVEPIIDTPWNVQLVERVALVSSRADQGDLTGVGGLNVLWVNRVNARPWTQFEGGIEYRMLLDLEAETAERGFLVEAGYLPDEHVRIGLGYNFTRFSDDVLTLLTTNARGPFLRVTARY